VTSKNVLVIYEIGAEHVETRLFFISVDEHELAKIKKCHGKYLDGAGNSPEDESNLEWLDSEIIDGKFKDARIKTNVIATLEKEDVPVTIVVTGHAL
jgi:hypothetical protein